MIFTGEFKNSWKPFFKKNKEVKKRILNQIENSNRKFSQETSLSKLISKCKTWNNLNGDICIEFPRGQVVTLEPQDLL